MIAGDIDDRRALPRLAQKLLHHVVVLLRPIPTAPQPPAVDDVADEIEFLGVVVTEKVEQQVGLASPAAEMDGQLPKEVVQERFDRLIAVQEENSLLGNQAQVGREIEVLVAQGEGRRDEETQRMSGRARDGRLVHFAATPGVRAGDVVHTVVTYAAPHYLVADGALRSHRRTRAGDNTEAGLRPKTSGVSLGLPSFGTPAPLAPAEGCAIQ